VLPQALRLHQQKDFDRLRQSGQVARHPALMLSFLSNDLGHNRYGFIIGKRIQKTAVGRNRLKRQLRAGIRALHPQLRPGYDLVWIARPALSVYDYDQIVQTLGQLARQAGLGPTEPIAPRRQDL
jgi:ribonuclease P protein component